MTKNVQKLGLIFCTSLLLGCGAQAEDVTTSIMTAEEVTEVKASEMEQTETQVQAYLDSSEWGTYLSYVNDTEGYLLCCSSPGAGLMEKQLFYTADAGETYSYVGDLSGQIAGYPQGIAAAGDGSLFIATTYHGDDTYLYRLTDGGATWNGVEVLASREGVSYVDCYAPTFDGNSGEIMLKVVTTDAITYQLYVTDDAGMSWTYEKDVDMEYSI